MGKTSIKVQPPNCTLFRTGTVSRLLNGMVNVLKCENTVEPAFTLRSPKSNYGVVGVVLWACSSKSYVSSFYCYYG